MSQQDNEWNEQKSDGRLRVWRVFRRLDNCHMCIVYIMYDPHRAVVMAELPCYSSGMWPNKTFVVWERSLREVLDEAKQWCDAVAAMEGLI